jgi:fructokinase
LLAVPKLHTENGNLYLQAGTKQLTVAVLGEVLWDLFDHSRRLGGAPLNFAANLARLGNNPLLISAVGNDSLGEEAAAAVYALGLTTAFLQRTSRFPTGAARVHLGPGDQTHFVIERPAAYDAVCISDRDLEQLIPHAPVWIYYGTLFASTAAGEATLCRLWNAVPAAMRFYDLNLRPDCWSSSLVKRLMRNADVVKLNEEELACVQEFTGLPRPTEAFCREGADRYGWNAVCVTLGGRGCAVLAHGDYVESEGYVVDVADTVGAGDAFAAAFMHGLVSEWPVNEIAAFANRVGALVASREGAIPAWTLEEAVAL